MLERISLVLGILSMFLGMLQPDLQPYRWWFVGVGVAVLAIVAILRIRHTLLRRWTSDSALFAHVAGLKPDENVNYHILFTHKGEHPRDTGPGEQYRLPSFPYDEAEAVMRTWFHAATALGLTLDHVRPRCGHSYGESRAVRRDVLAGSYAIVGSPKGNAACAELMQYLESRNGAKPPYVMKTKTVATGEEIAYLEPSNRSEAEKVPSPTKGAQLHNELEDWALIMRLPSVLPEHRNGSSVLLLAGCKVAGQVAATEWLFRRDTLMDLDRKYNGGGFCVVLHIFYKYVPEALPQIDLVEVDHQCAVPLQEVAHA